MIIQTTGRIAPQIKRRRSGLGKEQLSRVVDEA
jgi:hypothetical protein